MVTGWSAALVVLGIACVAVLYILLSLSASLDQLLPPPANSSGEEKLTLKEPTKRKANRGFYDGYRESFQRVARSLKNCPNPETRAYTLTVIDQILDNYLRDRVNLGLRDQEEWELITPGIMYFAGELADTPSPKRVGYIR